MIKKDLQITHEIVCFFRKKNAFYISRNLKIY